jgi:trk system potassium uptake protein TrkA
MRSELGLSMYINPEKAAAREIARVLRFPTAMKVDSLCKGRLELIEYRLRDNSALDGMSLIDLYRNIQIRILICAVTRNGETTIPSGDFVLRSGDKIYLTATPENLARFFQHLGVFRRQAASAMIVGASKICYYLTSELLNMGMDVKIIDRDKSRCVEMSERLPGALVIVGDGTDTELLQEEGIQQTDAFVAITGLDEANILMGLSAARVTNDNCKIVTKINRRSLVELVSNQEEIGCVVSAASVTTEMIVQYVRAMESASGAKIKTLHRLVEGAVEALEFEVPADAPFIGIPLKDLKLKSGILLAGIVRRNGQIVIPSGNDALQARDDVIVVTTGMLQDIHDIMQ